MSRQRQTTRNASASSTGHGSDASCSSAKTISRTRGTKKRIDYSPNKYVHPALAEFVTPRTKKTASVRKKPSETKNCDGCRKHPDAKPPFKQPPPLPSPTGQTRPRCRWCWNDITEKRRQTWCSNTCVEQYKMTLWPFARRAVEKRDRGLCRLCDTDTLWLQTAIKHSFIGDRESRHKLARKMQHVDVWRDPWEADHVKQRKEGGDHDLRNLRTLCVPCHKRETARYARERAARRKANTDRTT